MRSWIYWHLVVWSDRFNKWASAKHGRSIAREKYTDLIYKPKHQYTVRMRQYYGVVGKPIPNNSITQRQMEVELRG